jgi:glycosyltransferase involved in cell wall biosynthesis
MMMLVENLYKQVHGAELVYSLSGRWQQLAGSRLAEKLDVSHVIRLRGADEDIANDASIPKKLLYHLYFKPRIDQSWENAAKIVPIAAHLIDTLPPLLDYRTVSTTIPNGVNLNHFKPTLSPQNLVIGYVGRISPEKGSDFMHRLIKTTPNIKYLLAGPIQTTWNHYQTRTHSETYNSRTYRKSTNRVA